MAYVDTLTAVSNDGFEFTGDATHPSIVDSFRQSLRVVSDLPCDVLLTSPSASGMDNKLKGRAEGKGADPFVNPAHARRWRNRH